MTDRQFTRRRALELAGVSTIAAVLAGCADGGGGGNGGGGNGGGNGDGGGGGNGYEIDPGTTIEFNAQTAGWEGIAPSDIEGEQNPTLIVQEGESYEIGWTESDGASHNIEIRDDGGEVVDDLSTDVTDDPGDGQFLQFDASSEMAAYVCNPHENSMNGELQVE